MTGLYQQSPSIFADRSFCINKDIIVIIIIIIIIIMKKLSKWPLWTCGKVLATP